MAISKNLEILRLKKLLPRLSAHPRQKNKLNESDAEIIQCGNQTFALTTDLLSDEIHWGLYRKPETVGRMTAIISLSDLAAVGARPIGILLATHWGPKETTTYRRRFYRALSATLNEHGVHLLGGDQSSGAESVLCSTAFGQIQNKSRFRKSIKPGDSIYAIGNFGSGPALALRVLFKLPENDFPEKWFHPKVKFIDLSNFSTISMDVSDGLASTLCILSEINQVSFDINWPKTFFDKKSRHFCQKRKLPETTLFFAEHGDYQLVTSISPRHKATFEKKFPNAQKIATATSGSQSHRIFNSQDQWLDCDLDFFFNGEKSSLPKLRKRFEQWLKVAKFNSYR